MDYLYFKSIKGNFGDDLNPWLWPQLFNQASETDDRVFLGIGSILHQENEIFDLLKDKKKIVFGTGIRPSSSYTNFKMDDTWEVKFLRGPLSAVALQKRFEYITDAAYALRQLGTLDPIIRQEKKYEVSVMPYFHSVDYFDWQKICNTLGYHYISPFSERGVEYTLNEIAASKVLITEAMHGAIVADILRVPWHRFILTTPYTEGAMISEFKWSDWLQSVGIYSPEVTYIKFYQKTRANEWIKKLSGNLVSPQFMIKSMVANDLLKQLALPKETYLSADGLIQEIDEKIAGKVEEINKSIISGKVRIT
jgi:hypothetical protein